MVPCVALDAVYQAHKAISFDYYGRKICNEIIAVDDLAEIVTHDFSRLLYDQSVESNASSCDNPQTNKSHWLSQQTDDISSLMSCRYNPNKEIDRETKIFNPETEAHFTVGSYSLDDPFEPRPIHPSIEAYMSRKSTKVPKSMDGIILPLVKCSFLDLKNVCDNECPFDIHKSGMQSDGLDEVTASAFSSRSDRSSSFSYDNEDISRNFWEYSRDDSFTPAEFQTEITYKEDKRHNEIVVVQNSASLICDTRLKMLMAKSRQSQSLIQEWDKRNGLPQSHCCTMMHTNRSRKQLEEGRILLKWNGEPLIGKGFSRHSLSIQKKRNIRMKYGNEKTDMRKVLNSKLTKSAFLKVGKVNEKDLSCKR